MSLLENVTGDKGKHRASTALSTLDWEFQVIIHHVHYIAGNF
jgi:hypothetical protein